MWLCLVRFLAALLGLPLTHPAGTYPDEAHFAGALERPAWATILFQWTRLFQISIGEGDEGSGMLSVRVRSRFVL